MSQITFYTEKQREIEKWINECGFRTELEVPFGRYCADIYIPELNWVVEVDGPAHKYKKKKDKLRDQDIIDNHKVEHVLRVRVAIGKEVFKEVFIKEVKMIKGDNPFEKGAE
jgi:very-short-patch-repair endonuclease